VQYAEPLSSSFPWRATALVVGAVAAVELVALIAIGAVRLTPHHSRTTHAKSPAPQRVHTQPAAHVRPAAPTPSHPLRPRHRVTVLVLNGNGIQGAAATQAARLRASGYRISGAENAQRHDYARSMVMYVPGWIKEARRLAHDTGIRIVAPVDGLARSRLKGSKIVLILGT
jgi:hypothetical protein